MVRLFYYVYGLAAHSAFHLILWIMLCFKILPWMHLVNCTSINFATGMRNLAHISTLNVIGIGCKQNCLHQLSMGPCLLHTNTQSLAPPTASSFCTTYTISQAYTPESLKSCLLPFHQHHLKVKLSGTFSKIYVKAYHVRWRTDYSDI